VVAFTRDGRPVTARDLKADGAMTALMRYGIQPNLVQTLENNPAFVHGGPFANIAHGCNSVTATKLALQLADIAITEAGFAADLGAEKFFNIKCRLSGLRPDAVVLVATVKALKYHGGVRAVDLDTPDADAVRRGLPNLEKHIENLRLFGMPVVVSINAFSTDTEPERLAIRERCAELGAPVATSTHFSDGGAGAMELAERILETLESGSPEFRLLYPDDCPLIEKIRAVVRKIYGGDDVIAQTRILEKLKSFEAAGYGHYPVCMAKTQLSLSADPNLRGRPAGFVVHIRDVKLSTGPGFVVVLLGDIMTMPGLPRRPAAEEMDVGEDGQTVGLF